MFAAKLSSMLPSVCDITHFHHPHMCCVFALSATVWQVYRQCGRALFGMWYLGYVFRIFHFVLRKCKLELDAQPIRKVTLTFLITLDTFKPGLFYLKDIRSITLSDMQLSPRLSLSQSSFTICSNILSCIIFLLPLVQSVKRSWRAQCRLHTGSHWITLWLI